MPVFISYSHVNSEFATKLAEQLVKRNTHIWIDQWELRVGDSLIQKIQDALTGASALLVILSKASVESEWCKKELSTGLIRELDEKRVIVLPVLMEDCTIPLFLRDKVYADFRTNFDHGLKKVVDSIANVTSDTLMQTEEPSYITDWAIDTGYLEGLIHFSIIAIEHAKDGGFSVMTEINITGNERATEMFDALAEVGLDWVERGALLEALSQTADEQGITLRLDDEHQQHTGFGFRDPRLGVEYIVNIRSRRVGKDNGFALHVNVGGKIKALRDAQRARNRRASPEEFRKWADVHNRFSTHQVDPSDYVAM